MKNRGVLNSTRLSELRRKKYKIFKRKIVLYFLVFLMLFIGLGFISQISGLNIKKIKVSGNKIVESKKIENIIQKDITGYYLWLFSKTNFLLYPKHKIKKDLIKNYERLKEVSLHIENTKILNVSVSEYGGKYLWCGENIPILDISENPKCYFLDENGYVFDEAPFFSGEVYFKFYGQNNENLLGSYFIKDTWNNFISFKKNLEEINLKPTAFWLDENKDGNIALSSEPMAGPRIIFKIDSDYQKITDNLQSALNTEPLHSEFRDKFSSLLYLDLRFGSKVFYKFK